MGQVLSCAAGAACHGCGHAFACHRGPDSFDIMVDLGSERLHIITLDII